MAALVFGPGLATAERFAELLADTGVSHGLIGPREVPRIWDRHLVNCAVIESAFALYSRVIDVGSGAGLPGLPLAIVRPDLDVHLVEPMLRRTTWLEGVIDDLGLDNVTVHRGRASDLSGQLSAPAVTARAVARLGLLAAWCLPLTQSGGVVLALKGATADAELEEQRPALDRLRVESASVERYGEGLIDPPTTVVRMVAGPSGPNRSGKRRTVQRPRSGRREP